jgi:hypothetical protein
MYGQVDDNMVLSDAQVVGTDAANEASTDQQRLPVDPVSLEYQGGDIYLNVGIDTTFAGGTNIRFEIWDAADDGNNAPDTFAVFLIGPTRTVASNQLDAKKKIWSIQIPPGCREWVEAYYTVTGSMTAGKVDAYLSDTPMADID